MGGGGAHRRRQRGLLPAPAGPVHPDGSLDAHPTRRASHKAPRASVARRRQACTASDWSAAQLRDRLLAAAPGWERAEASSRGKRAARNSREMAFDRPRRAAVSRSAWDAANETQPKRSRSAPASRSRACCGGPATDAGKGPAARHPHPCAGRRGSRSARSAGRARPSEPGALTSHASTGVTGFACPASHRCRSLGGIGRA